MMSGDFSHSHGASQVKNLSIFSNMSNQLTKLKIWFISISPLVSPILTTHLFCQTLICTWPPKCPMHPPHSHRRGCPKTQPCLYPVFYFLSDKASQAPHKSLGAFLDPAWASVPPPSSSLTFMPLNLLSSHGSVYVGLPLPMIFAPRSTQYSFLS